MRPIPLWLRAAIAVAGAFGLLVFLLPGLLASATGARLRQVAAARGLSASWGSMRGTFPLGLAITELAFTDSTRGEAPLTAESLSLSIDPLSVLMLHPRLLEARLSHARIETGGSAGADPDTLAPEDAEHSTARGTQERVKRSAESLVESLLLPARRLPRLRLEDVEIESAPQADALGRGVQIERLEVSPARGGVHARAEGTLELQERIPFVATLDWARDDRLAGVARLMVPAPGDTFQPLSLSIDGAVTQDRRAGVVRIADTTRVTVGRLPFSLGGTLDKRGPRVQLLLAAKDLTAEGWRESLPDAMLGPLANLAVRGSYDYRVSLDLDLASPDSVRFDADVTPHGLQLDAARTTLPILGLDGPFTATIHLPRGRFTTRELGPGNIHYRPLEGIAPALVHAVVTNEDGAFFRHRGFNPDAIRASIAENLRAGSFRRGAGTITMQLARNLYLGHERTLSRKAQEVVLAWVLEHLTGLSKDRLLEIYLNIIEWGPGVHGADEAARYYFDQDASELTVDEALFLATVVPAPAKWRYRFDASGDLRPFERAQMHFIGRAMINKGWLAPEDLPPADSLRVRLRGPAVMEVEPS